MASLRSELQEHKAGLRTVMGLIESHKHLVLEDMMEQISLYKSNRSQVAGAYEVLAVTLQVLFNKLKKNKDQAMD